MWVTERIRASEIRRIAKTAGLTIIKAGTRIHGFTLYECRKIYIVRHYVSTPTGAFPSKNNCLLRAIGKLISAEELVSCPIDPGLAQKSLMLHPAFEDSCRFLMIDSIPICCTDGSYLGII